MSDPQPASTAVLAQRAELARLALRMSGNRDEADELVQETLLVALERPPHRHGNLGAWLGVVLRRVWHRRRRHAARQRPLDHEPALPARDAPIGSTVERSEAAAELARRLVELDEPYRTVVYLRFYDDRSPTQIAALLGRPLGTVTSQLTRGMERLRVRAEIGARAGT